MISLFKKEHWQLFWVMFHIGLGVATGLSKWPLIVWYYLMIVSFAGSLFFGSGNARHSIIYFLGYSIGIEVMARAVYATPFIPDQTGKYLGILMFSIGLTMGGPIKRTSAYGVLMLLLSLPALAIAPEYTRKMVVFNYAGPLALFLGVMFCSRQIFTFSDVKNLFRIILFPVISAAVFTLFKASQVENLQYGLSANFESSGGSTTNQVATLIGAGISILFLANLTGQRLFKFALVDIAVFIFITVRGLLTFSRGGMLSALLAILAVILWPKAAAVFQDQEIQMKKIKPSSVFFSALLIVITILAINQYTNNFLFYRYQGKTERSLKTGFDNTLTADQITSGRITIMNSDIAIFLGNPFLGVGVGWSMVVRPQYGGPPAHASHLEFSRLLSEHGLPGLVLVIMIFIYPFFEVNKRNNNYTRSIMLIFLIVGLSATFHSAMRTMITPLLFSFAFIKFVPTNYDWQSQLKEAQNKVRNKWKRPVKSSQLQQTA